MEGLIERNLITQAEILHEKAQQVRKDEGQDAARPWYRRTVDAYRAYFDIFSDSTHALQKRNQLAHAYFFGLEDFEKAAEHWAIIRESGGGQGESPLHEEGAYLAIQARQARIVALAEAGDGDIPTNLLDTSEHTILGEIGEIDEEDPTKLVSVVPAAIPEPVRTWQRDAERYLELGLTRPKNKDFSGRLSYLIARVYYRYGHFDMARGRLRKVLEEHPDYKLLIAYTYLDLIRMAMIRNDLEMQERIAHEMENSGIGDPDPPCPPSNPRRSRMGVRFLRANKLLEQGEAALRDPARQDEARKLYFHAAVELEALVDESPDFSEADLALLSAAKAYETVQHYEKASSIYCRIVNEKRFEDSEYRELAMHHLARNYKLFFDFERSTRTFKRLVRDYPKSQYCKEALLEAASLQENDQDYAGTAETLKEYLAQFPDSRFEPKLRLLIPRLYKRAGLGKSMAVAYGDFLERYSKSPEWVAGTMEAALVVGNLARGAGKERQAMRHYTTVRDAFDEGGLEPETKNAARAAEAAFWLLERPYQASLVDDRDQRPENPGEAARGVEEGPRGVGGGPPGTPHEVQSIRMEYRSVLSRRHALHAPRYGGLRDARSQGLVRRAHRGAQDTDRRPGHPIPGQGPHNVVLGDQECHAAGNHKRMDQQDPRGVEKVPRGPPEVPENHEHEAGLPS